MLYVVFVFFVVLFSFVVIIIFHICTADGKAIKECLHLQLKDGLSPKAEDVHII